jgi:hypothetical protein
MTIRIQMSVTIARPVPAVWEIVGDFAHDRRWRTGIYRSERTSPGPMAAGANARGGRALPRARHPHALGRDAYEPGRCYSFATTKGQGTHALERKPLVLSATCLPADRLIPYAPLLNP